jgi:diacylglycerol kinase (ATP)
MKLAVVAHSGKTFGGGLPELRRTLADAGISSPLWFEVPKSKRAPGAVERALEEGAELVVAWGGDGLVRRCVNALGNTQIPLAVCPAGTSNLFATNLGIERDIGKAVETALHGDRRRLDVGRFNGERFAVMAGAGFDAAMIKGADDLKDRVGRAGYVLSGAAQLNAESFEAKIKIDGTRWYKGPATCVLIGNVGDLFGGIEVFADARPDDGLLDVGVLTSDGPVQLARAVARTAVGTTQKSPFVRVTQGRSVRVKLDRKVRYELDGGDRTKIKSFKADVEPGAITVCVPRAAPGGDESDDN